MTICFRMAPTDYMSSRTAVSPTSHPLPPCHLAHSASLPSPSPACPLPQQPSIPQVTLHPHLALGELIRQLHGYSTPTNTADFTLRASGQPANDKITLSRLRLYYERPLKAHAIRDWLSSHPRLVLPAVAFLIGTLSYTVSPRVVPTPSTQPLNRSSSSTRSEPSSSGPNWRASGT